MNGRMTGSSIAPIWRIVAQNGQDGPVGPVHVVRSKPRNERPQTAWTSRPFGEPTAVSIANLTALPEKRATFDRIPVCAGSC